MKYMTMVSSAESYGPPPAGLIEAIMKLGEEASKAGVLVEQGGLHRTAKGLRMRISNGVLTVTDGPFAEAKEVIGGYAVYSVSSKEQIVEWTRRFMEIHQQYWPDWEGVAEVRQIFDPSDFAPGAA